MKNSNDKNTNNINTQENKKIITQSNSTNIKKRVMTKIKKENIKPQPKIYFKLKNILFWILLLFSIITGIIATGMLFYFQASLDDYFFTHRTFQDKLQFFATNLPIFWIIAFFLSLYGAIKAYRNTKYGYKVPSLILIASIVTVLIVIGTHTIITTTLEKFDIQSLFPRYMQIRSRHEKNWICPDYGLIAGKISSIDKRSNAITISSNKKKWKVDVSDISHFSDQFHHCGNKKKYFRHKRKIPRHCSSTQKSKDTTHKNNSKILDIFAKILLDKNTIFIRAEGKITDDLQFNAEKLFPTFYHHYSYTSPENFKYLFDITPHPRNKEPPR